MPSRCPSSLRPAGPSALGVGRTWSRGARGTWHESHPECSRQASVNSLRRTNTFWASTRYHGQSSRQSKKPLTILLTRQKSIESCQTSRLKFTRSREERRVAINLTGQWSRHPSKGDFEGLWFASVWFKVPHHPTNTWSARYWNHRCGHVQSIDHGEAHCCHLKNWERSGCGSSECWFGHKEKQGDYFQ